MSFKVYMNEGERDQICDWVLKHKDIETGGDLFGLWLDEHTAVVQFVLGPGNDCRRTATSFFQDVDYLRDAGTFLANKHGLCNVGQWHSHHRIKLFKPSAGDKNTVWNNMPGLGLDRYIVFIANITDRVTINCFLFQIKYGRQRPVEHGKFKFLSGNSPLRLNKNILENVFVGAESFNQLTRYEGEMKNFSPDAEAKEGASNHNESESPAEKGTPISWHPNTNKITPKHTPAKVLHVETTSTTRLADAKTSETPTYWRDNKKLSKCNSPQPNFTTNQQDTQTQNPPPKLGKPKMVSVSATILHEPKTQKTVKETTTGPDAKISKTPTYSDNKQGLPKRKSSENSTTTQQDTRTHQGEPERISPKKRKQSEEIRSMGTECQWVDDGQPKPPDTSRRFSGTERVNQNNVPKSEMNSIFDKDEKKGLSVHNENQTSNPEGDTTPGDPKVKSASIYHDPPKPIKGPVQKTPGYGSNIPKERWNDKTNNMTSNKELDNQRDPQVNRNIVTLQAGGVTQTISKSESISLENQKSEKSRANYEVKYIGSVDDNANENDAQGNRLSTYDNLILGKNETVRSSCADSVNHTSTEINQEITKGMPKTPSATVKNETVERDIDASEHESGMNKIDNEIHIESEKKQSQKSRKSIREFGSNKDKKNNTKKEDTRKKKKRKVMSKSNLASKKNASIDDDTIKNANDKSEKVENHGNNLDGRKTSDEEKKGQVEEGSHRKESDENKRRRNCPCFGRP